MRRKLLVTLSPVLIATATLLVSPAPVAAAEVVETGATTYTVNVADHRIDVSIELRITNNKPPDGHYIYYWDRTQVAVEAQAGAVKMTSNGGRVSQSVAKSDRWYRYINIGFPKVYYRQTRVITITYSIDARPRAPGGFRAVKAYVDVCAIGSGYDSGTVKVVLPAEFGLNNYTGEALQDSGVSGDTRTLVSGTLSAPYKFWSCFDATNPDALITTKETVAGQKFEIQSWPEDPDWKAMLEGQLAFDIEGLQKMNGLDLPGGTIVIREVGNSELGEYAGMYNSKTQIAYVTEQTGADIVAHELSHIWYNHTLFSDKWASEGLAGYSEQLAGSGQFTPCVEPGKYPGTGSPDLNTWVSLDMSSTTQDVEILDYEYDAACYIFTELADQMGEENLKAVLMAAANGEMAYQGSTPGETDIVSMAPLSGQALLDLIDERGMIPAGIDDLDQAQDLLGKYGIFTKADLADRSEARAAYHKLADQAGDWDLPLAVREPMASWKFAEASTAMKTAGQIVAARDEIEAKLSDFSFDGTKMQTRFEDIEEADDLDSLAETAQQEVEAAAVLAEARAAESGGRNPLAMIGLLGADLQSPLSQATDALKNLHPDDAETAAQGVLDQVNGATTAGVVRLVVLLGLLALVVLAFVLFRKFRSRRAAALALAAVAIGETGASAEGEAAAEGATDSAAGEPTGPPPPPPA